MEFAKKLFTKAVQYLNVAFVGYEISEITQNSHAQPTQQIIQTKTIEKEETSTHITVIIAFGIVICILLTILFAIKIILSNKKHNRKSATSTNSANIEWTIH